MHYRIEGMDCARCVGKVETALARMPGVSDIQLNFATERLELTLAPDSVTQAADIEKVIKDLGFGVTAVRPMGSETLMDDSSSAPRWWQTRNGKQVVALRSEEHTSELQSRGHLVCRLLLEKKDK